MDVDHFNEYGDTALTKIRSFKTSISIDHVVKIYDFVGGKFASFESWWWTLHMLVKTKQIRIEKETSYNLIKSQNWLKNWSQNWLKKLEV